VSSLNATSKGVILSLEKAKEEASYALSGAKVDPFNESPWRYLIGVLMEQWRYAQRKGEAEDVANANNLLREYVTKVREMKQSWNEQQPSADIPAGPCPNLLSALVDLLEIFTEDKECLAQAKDLLEELVVEDPVRRKYWQRRANGISKLLEKCMES